MRAGQVPGQALLPSVPAIGGLQDYSRGAKPVLEILAILGDNYSGTGRMKGKKNALLKDK